MSHVGAMLAALLLQDFDPRPLQPFLKKHCADCHMDGASKGGLDLDQAPSDLGDAETLRRWVRLFDRVRDGEMPPPKKAALAPAVGYPSPSWGAVSSS